MHPYWLVVMVWRADYLKFTTAVLAQCNNKYYTDKKIMV